MKKNIFLLLFSLTIASNLYSQNKTIKIAPADFCNSNKSPLMLLNGETIIVNCDTAYLVNKWRYSFYKNIHEATLSDKDSLSSKISNAFEQKLIEQQNAYDKLLGNCKLSEKITLDLINETQNSLVSAQKTLDYTQKTLDSSLKSLELANDYIKKEKWNSKGKKILIGAGGFGVGLITGMVIMK